MKRSFLNGVGAAVVAVAMLLGSAVGASAAAVPDRGPAVGGTTVTVPTPPYPAGTAFTSVSASFAEISHSVAVGADGKLYAWGANNYGQLGNGTTTASTTPVLVHTPAGVTFTRVSVGDSHTLAVGSDGNTYAWGLNSSGQLGDGTTTNRLTPVVVQAPTGVTFSSVNIGAGASHSVAIGSDGNTYAWGSNLDGQLGDGTTTNRLTPVVVQAPTGVTFSSISIGSFHNLATGSDGNTYAWGWNAYGQLGDGTTTNRSAPVLVKVPAGVSFTDLNAGGLHSLVLGSDGKTYAWGYNAFGQLGDGTTTSRSAPVPVKVPAGVSFTDLNAGGLHSLALGSDGKTYAWGYNAFGQLGDGTTTSRSTPVVVKAPSGVTFTSFNAGRMQSLFVGSDHQVYAVGGNDNGQLGIGTTTNQSIPVAVTFAVVTGVTFGGVAGTDLALQADGTWSVVTPAQSAGRVDVAVSWTFAGVAQTPVVYPAGFLFTQAELLTYGANGGEGTTSPTAGVTDGTVAVASSGFSRAGWSFTGWNTAADGSGTGYAVGDDFVLAVGTNVLFAQWSANAATLSYDANGGVGDQMDPTAGVTGQPVTLTANAYTKAGYTFAGWNTAADGSGTGLAEGGTFTLPAGSTTLYAQWVSIPAPPPAAITVNPTTIIQGGTGVVTGTGFTAGETVNLWLHSDPVLLATVTADSSGNLNARVTIPSNTALGTHTLAAADQTHTAQASLQVISAPVGPANGDDQGASLASTGSRVMWPLGILGMILVIVGVCVVSKRKRLD